ncbi:MAG: cyclase family protein [Gemmatimonadetes bacterium]|nr:cyclase family protein [Gemmatimonadota bacterium]
MARATSTLAALTGFLLATGCLQDAPPPDHTTVFTGGAGEWVELSHAFGPSTIYWPTDTAGFQLTELAYGNTDGGYFYASYSFASAEHGGTHLDAPIHFAEGRMTADEIPLSSLITTASVVDVSAAADADADYLLSVGDLTAWEAEHGQLADGTALLVRTGWSSRWEDRTAYLGTDLTGPEAVPELHFPGIGPEAAQWLVDNRAVAAVGIDTPSIDYGQSSDYRSHVILYSANIVGFENLTNLDALPATGAGIVALPMKIVGGSGGPLRVVGWVPG